MCSATVRASDLVMVRACGGNHGVFSGVVWSDVDRILRRCM